MPIHRDATYINLHPPRGASLSGGDEPLTLLDSAYAVHWENVATRDVLLVDTSFANLTIATLGNATDPAALILPGASEIQAQQAVLRVQASDPAAPSNGVTLYSKDVAGVDQLFARSDTGSIHQITPASGGGFDPTAITLTDNLSGAFRAHEGANDYIRVDTTDAGELITLGNPTTDPDILLDASVVRIGPATGVGSVSLVDDANPALRFQEGSNVYLAFRTSNAAEEIQLGNATTNPDLVWTGSGEWRFAASAGTSGYALTSNGAGAAPTWQAAGGFDPTAITLTDNLSGAFRAVEGSNDYIRVNTTDAAESIILGNATTNPSFSLLGSGAVLWGAARQITIPDNTASVFRLMEGSNEYFGVATTNASEAIRFGNATTNPAFTFAGTGTLSTNGWSFISDGRIARATAGQYLIGHFNSNPSGTNIVAIGDFPNVTTFTNDDRILIGRATSTNLSAARCVIIAAVGASGAMGSDSITIQSAGGGGATGNRAISIGGGMATAGAEAIGIGYATVAAHSNTVCLGRAAASTAANQLVVGGNGQPVTTFYLGEGVTKSSAFTATAIAILPTEATGTDRDGLPMAIFGGTGTGTGNTGATAGALNLFTSPPIGTGSTQHTPEIRLRLRGDGIMLQASHGAISAGVRDEALHHQTGAGSFVTQNVWVTLISMTPENAAGRYHAFLQVGGIDNSETGVRTSVIQFYTSGGTATILDEHIIRDTVPGTGLQVQVVASGGNVNIEARTTQATVAGRASAWCHWQGAAIT